MDELDPPTWTNADELINSELYLGELCMTSSHTKSIEVNMFSYEDCIFQEDVNVDYLPLLADNVLAIIGG